MYNNINSQNQVPRNLNTMIGVDAVIFIFCLLGCGISAWYLGHREGIEDAVQYFIDNGIIEVDEDFED